jgi:hypothetical protein
MRAVPIPVAVYVRALGLVAGLGLPLLLGACAPAHLVAGDPRLLARIRTVYVLPFDSLEHNAEAAAVMTQALKRQLQYDRVLQVVEHPGLADAYFQGTVGTWARGGLDLNGARSTVISGSLDLLTPTGQRLWYVAAVQRDPLRLVAHGLFARDPTVLAPHWARTVLQHLPGYAVKGQPDAQAQSGAQVGEAR